MSHGTEGIIPGGNLTLRYDKIAAKAIPEVTTSSRSKVKGEPKRNQGFPIRSK